MNMDILKNYIELYHEKNYNIQHAFFDICCLDLWSIADI